MAGTTDGFLLDTETGALWMTGACLKPLAVARRDGLVWRSETSEFVSVGRHDVLLSQRFELNVSETSPSITVENGSRGGAQAIRPVELISCALGACNSLASAEPC